jgi:hypothetical protein
MKSANITRDLEASHTLMLQQYTGQGHRPLRGFGTKVDGGEYRGGIGVGGPEFHEGPGLLFPEYVGGDGGRGVLLETILLVFTCQVPIQGRV